MFHPFISAAQWGGTGVTSISPRKDHGAWPPHALAGAALFKGRLRTGRQHQYRWEVLRMQVPGPASDLLNQTLGGRARQYAFTNPQGF